MVMGFVDVFWVLKKVKKVKKKFEFFMEGSYIEGSLGYYNISDVYYMGNCMVYNYGGRLIWLNLFGCELGRLFFFVRVIFYDYGDFEFCCDF